MNFADLMELFLIRMILVPSRISFFSLHLYVAVRCILPSVFTSLSKQFLWNALLANVADLVSWLKTGSLKQRFDFKY